VSAASSSLDAAAIDRVLTAIAAVAEPGDTRTLQQRLADALVDVLLGRISNGCHTRRDGLDDNGFDEDRNADDRIDDDSVHETTRDDAQNNAVDDQPAGCEAIAEGWDADSDQEPTPDHPDTDTPEANTGIRTFDADIEDPDRGVAAAEACAEAGADDAGSAVADTEPAAPGGAPADADPDADADLNPDVDAGPDFDGDTDAEADFDDSDLPASAFRPDPAATTAR